VVGAACHSQSAGYDAVYTFEILLLFVSLAALGPLVRVRRPATAILVET
jgi:hypothetical protein